MRGPPDRCRRVGPPRRHAGEPGIDISPGLDLIRVVGDAQGEIALLAIFPWRGR